MTTVLEYFADAFPGCPMTVDVAKDLQSMPIDSPCGRDCVKAIDNASAFYNDVVDGGHGGDMLAVRDAALRVVLIYICG